jgi:hypothetical protein
MIIKQVRGGGSESSSSSTSSAYITEHLLSPHKQCFKNGLYREHKQSYDYYYNNQTGKLLLVTTNDETGEQEVFSFWIISKM